MRCGSLNRFDTVVGLTLISLLGSLTGGCGRDTDAADDGDSPRPEIQREILTSSWSTDLRIGGPSDDSTLQAVIHPVVNSSGIYVADIAAKRVMRLSHDGVVLWKFGGHGSGPNEFQEPRDIRLDSSGRIWVLDPANGRITILTPEGLVYRRISLDRVGKRAFEVIPLEDQGALLVTAGPDSPFVRIDSTGVVTENLPFPWPGFTEMNFMATQLVTAADPEAGVWVTGFRMGDSFFSFDNVRWEGYRGWFAEPIKFPVLTVTRNGNATRTHFPERPVSAAISVTLSPKRLYVLFGGHTERRKRIVDSFSRVDGSYEGTYILPEPAMEIAWHEGGLYVLQENPYPELVYLTPSGSQLP